MRWISLAIMIVSLSLYGCRGEEEKQDNESSAGATSEDQSEDDEPEEIEEVENPEEPSFSQEDSDELREEKHRNGQDKARGYMRRDANDNYVRVGPWKYWYRNGNVKESGSYVDDKKVGQWKSWHSKGQKESERHFLDEVEHGTFSIWDKKGQLLESGAHNKGQKHGQWKRWYKANAQQEYEQSFNKGKKTGRWISWRKSGQKKEETHYRADLKHGPTETWSKKGNPEKKGAYKRDLKHGKWSTWYANGQKRMEADFKMGEKVPGTISEWNSKGKLLDPDRVRAYLYGRDNCKWTRKALKRLKESDINYVYRRTDKSQRNYDKFSKASAKYGCRGVPLAIIDGKAICGFSEKDYRRLLR